MTDIPYRVYGPQPLNGGLGETLYTAPPGTNKFFIRDLTFTNIDSTNVVHVHVSIGDITNPSKRVLDQDMTAATSTFVRPLWLLDAGETLQGLQIGTGTTWRPTLTSVATIGTGTDGTSAVTGLWTPAATTVYLLIAHSGVASGTTALTPSSITGNGTWTAITGGSTTSTVASAVNGSVAAYWFYSSAAGSSATTTVNYASTQHSFDVRIFSVANTYSGTAAVPPWTATAVPYLQAVAAADSTAPASTNQSKTVTIAATQTGSVTYHHGRFGSNSTSTATTGFTEITDTGLSDVSGSVASYDVVSEYVTAPPWTSTTVGPSTYSTSTTNSRVGLAIEWVPANWVNCMVSGIEVH